MLLNKQVQNLLGLAERAKQLAYGENVVQAIRKGKAALVLYASDASQNTQKMITDKSAYYQVEAIMVDDSQLLSSCVGKSGRMAVAILDHGFARKIKEKLGVGESDGKNE